MEALEGLEAALDHLHPQNTRSAHLQQLEALQGLEAAVEAALDSPLEAAAEAAAVEAAMAVAMAESWVEAAMAEESCLEEECATAAPPRVPQVWQEEREGAGFRAEMPWQPWAAYAFE